MYSDLIIFCERLVRFMCEVNEHDVYTIYGTMIYIKSGKVGKNENLSHFACKNFGRNVLFKLIKFT